MITKQQEQQRIQQILRQDKQSDNELTQNKREALAFIRDHLTVFYAKYANENGLSLVQTQQRVSQWDLVQWKQALNELPIKEWPIEAKKRAKLYSYEAGIDRQHLITALVGLGVVSMYVEHVNSIKQTSSVFKADELKRMQTSFNLPVKKVRRIEALIKPNISHSQASKDVLGIKIPEEQVSLWSDNIWLKSDEMVNDIQNLVNRHVQKGMQLTDLDRLLTEHTNAQQFKPTKSIVDRMTQAEYQARRIIRTETANIKYQVSMNTYKDIGTKQVTWVAEPGACQECSGIEEGSPYYINDVPSIPVHANCRCSIIPYDENITY